MEALVRILHEKGCSLVVRKNDEIRTYCEKGVRSLLNLLLNDKDFLLGSEIADKVVGKAAAALIIEGKVKAIHADVISHLATDILKNAHITFTYTKEVDRILSHDRQGLCPMEILTESAKTEQEAVDRIKAKLLTQ